MWKPLPGEEWKNAERNLEERKVYKEGGKLKREENERLMVMVKQIFM